jgi:hypothetical protein
MHFYDPTSGHMPMPPRRPIALFFYKSSPIPEGAHWITVHPNGSGTKGQPVLVQPVSPGSKTVHVIGGAGGKLNYLKFTSTKSAPEYAKESAERAKDRRQAQREQRARDKERGVTDTKKQAKDEIAVKRRAAENEFIRTVADAMGWKQSDVAFDPDTHADLDDKELAKAAREHHRSMLTAAKDAVTLQRKRLLIDADARRQAFTGEMPLHTDAATVLSVSDLDPVKPDTGMGFDPAYKARAEAAGLTPQKLQQQKSAAGSGTSGKQQAAEPGADVDAASVSRKMGDELARINADRPNLKARLVDVDKAVGLLKAQKQLANLQRAARDATGAIDRSIEPQAYVLETTPVNDEQIARSIEDDLRTMQTVSFLDAVAKADPQSRELVHHIAAGAFNSIHALSLAAGGDALIDRSVVDVLGIAGAAQVLARRLRTDLGNERIEQISDAMGEFHVQHYSDLSTSALADVTQLHEAAKQYELEGASSTDDLLVRAELNKKRIDALSDAQKVLGRSLGEMEANAALTYALQEPSRDVVHASLGNTQLDTAIRQLYALGLNDGDYALEKAGSNTFVTVYASGMDKLTQPVDHEGLATVRRNLAIMNGAEDEDGWMPEGFANRADLALKLPPGVAESMAIPFAPGGDLEQSVRDYIGSRTADGDMPADILSDLQSAAFFDKVGTSRSAEYRAALDTVAPNRRENGRQLQRAEELAPLFDRYADAFVASHWGGRRSTLNRQSFDADDIAQEALHRALSAEPTGASAYKPIGDLNDGDMRALRNYFYQRIAKESPQTAQLRTDLGAHDRQEPDKMTTDLFGDTVVNPDHQAWTSARNDLIGQIKASGSNWTDYVKTMRSPAAAYSAIQDKVRSTVSAEFAKHYNTLNPDKPLKLGKTVIRGNLNHLDAIDPAAREARVRSERELVDALRERHQGRYAAGTVADKLDGARQSKVAFEQAQMGFFSADEAPASAGASQAETKPLALDERHTIGHAAENRLASMMGVVGRNFVPGQPVKLFHASMSGKDGVKRQRAIKFLKANKRMFAGLGVGSGKTGIGLGAFADLHSAGKIKKGVFVVPSIVQGQFGAEALRFLKPGQFNWHCQPGASHAERLSAYRDKNVDFHVVTHQSFRDDLLKIAAKQQNVSPDHVAQQMEAMTGDERQTFMKDVLDREGIHFDYAMADEGHGLLNREGKENSRLSNTVQAVTDNAAYYLHASGDPVKNDASEAFDLLSKMDRKRYSDRGAFMRRYGADTTYAKEGLRRELARHGYTAAITPDVNVTRHVRQIEMTPAQHAALDAIDRQVAAARIAKMQGKVDIGALQSLSPDSFAGSDESQHEAIAHSLTQALGVIANAATNRVINAHADSGKLNDIEYLADSHKDRPGVVFARSLDAVDQIKARLEAKGHRVIVVTGKDSSKDKAAKIRAFNPDSGERKADIVVCSDAGAVGANLQSGSWLAQYDTPDTAMVYNQRAGRIARVGQRNDVDLYDLVANHRSERRSRARLARKQDLREVVTSPLDGLDDTGLASFLFKRNQTRQQAMAM